MSLLQRKRKPMPPSVKVYEDPPWVEPAELAPRWWQRIASGTSLVGLVVVLGVILAVMTGIVLLLAFFVLDFVIS
jgi:hypothetical protein